MKAHNRIPIRLPTAGDISAKQMSSGKKDAIIQLFGASKDTLFLIP
jgi:hypothetical protein